MKVLKGLVLTMLVSTATIFAADPSLVEGDLSTSGKVAAKTTGFDTGSIVIDDNGVITRNQDVAGDTIDHTSVIPLSSREVAAISLSRLITAGGIDENTSFVLSTALSTLGKGTNSAEDAIAALTGLTTGGGVSVETYARVQSVVDVLNSEIEGVHTWMQTPNGMLTDRAETGVSPEGMVVGTTLFSLTAKEVNTIELSRLVADLATKLETFNPFTLSATETEIVMDSMARTYDAINVVNAEADVVDLSSSVMGLGIVTSSLPAGVAEESNTAEGGF